VPSGSNMSEFAYSGIGLNPHYGTPCNPCDPGTARSPCGSSSGSGVAVAAGPACHGNDSGGRVPASFNRVVGYIVDRALFDGRRSSASRALDTRGPLANTVEDCVLVDAALRGLSEHALLRDFDATILGPIANVKETELAM